MKKRLAIIPDELIIYIFYSVTSLPCVRQKYSLAAGPEIIHLPENDLVHEAIPVDK